MTYYGHIQGFIPNYVYHLGIGLLAKINYENE